MAYGHTVQLDRRVDNLFTDAGSCYGSRASTSTLDDELCRQLTLGQPRDPVSTRAHGAGGDQRRWHLCEDLKHGGGQHRDGRHQRRGDARARSARNDEQDRERGHARATREQCTRAPGGCCAPPLNARQCPLGYSDRVARLAERAKCSERLSAGESFEQRVAKPRTRLAELAIVFAGGASREPYGRTPRHGQTRGQYERRERRNQCDRGHRQQHHNRARHERPAHAQRFVLQLIDVINKR